MLEAETIRRSERPMSTGIYIPFSTASKQAKSGHCGSLLLAQLLFAQSRHVLGSVEARPFLLPFADRER
jgi:hypothetical protein